MKPARLLRRTIALLFPAVLLVLFGCDSTPQPPGPEPPSPETPVAGERGPEPVTPPADAPSGTAPQPGNAD